MDHLWAPWRMEYILSDEEEGCIFCDCRDSDCELDLEKLVLYRGENNFIILNKYPYNNGHLMIIPYKHINNFSTLADDTLLEMMQLAKKSERILKKVLQPDGFNMGINLGKVAGAGIEDHIHLHIVPRWNGDTNFMPVLGEVRVVPQAIEETYKTLITHFDELKD